MDPTLSLFLKGIPVGIAMAAPMGPVAILCVRRTLAQGLSAGLATGLGAAAGDVLFATLAAVGVHAVAQWVDAWQRPLLILGGLVLIGLGLKAWFTDPPDPQAPPERTPKGLAGDFAGSLVITLTNPMTLFAFLAAFAGLGLGGAGGNGGDGVTTGLLTVCAIVGGVAVGASITWFGLCLVVAAYRRKCTRATLKTIDRIAAVVIGSFGLGLIIWACLPAQFLKHAPPTAGGPAMGTPKADAPASPGP